MDTRTFLIVTSAAIVVLMGCLLMTKYQDCLAEHPAHGCPALGPRISKTGPGLLPAPPRDQ